MEKLLFKIRETFQFKDAGLLVATDIKIKDTNLKTGDEIKLLLPDGSEMITEVASIPMSNPYDPEKPFTFSLPAGINEEDIPPGTEVWSHP